MRQLIEHYSSRLGDVAVRWLSTAERQVDLERAKSTA